MTSTIAWLDTTTSEQNRINEIIRLFRQPESRDELGIGQIRDAFSDLLFPGTSVIQTRARYFLFVPWLFLEGVRLGYSGFRLKTWVEGHERKLVETLRQAGDLEGLIGRRAGPAVKILPSTIYWSGLVRYGILTRNVAADQLRGRPSTAGGGADELADRAIGDWAPTLPAMPEGFPDAVDGFSLTKEESAWLSERIAASAPHTLLAHLLERGSPPDGESTAPWLDSACHGSPAAIREVMKQAELFSLGMHGAALLYNLLLGELYERKEFTTVEAPADTFGQRLTAWVADCGAADANFRAWDRNRLWQLVLGVNPRISPGTRMFVDTWLDAVMSGQTRTCADDQTLRQLVKNREQAQKKAQSRLTNERMLRVWSGESGSAPITYRWPQVRRMIRDIYEGLGTDAGS